MKLKLSDLQDALEAVETGEGHLLLDDAEFLADIIKTAMSAYTTPPKATDGLREAIREAIKHLRCLEAGKYLNGEPIRESMRPSFANSIAEDLQAALTGAQEEHHD